MENITTMVLWFICPIIQQDVHDSLHYPDSTALHSKHTINNSGHEMQQKINASDGSCVILISRLLQPEASDFWLYCRHSTL